MICVAAVIACRLRHRRGGVPHGGVGRPRARCVGCGYEAIAYNSCRNRHCPKCQGSRTAAWLQREQSWLLPVPYYFVVFTLPPAVAA